LAKQSQGLIFIKRLKMKNTRKIMVSLAFAFAFVLPVVSEAVPPSVPTPPPAPTPAPTPASTSSDEAPKQGSRRRDVSGLISRGGQVLGASTCEPYLNEYIKFGSDNNPEEVKKLQMFLNEFMGANLDVSGSYNENSFEWVKKFQSLHALAILKPWVDAGLPTEATGYVYKTTKRWINLMKCPESVVSTPLPLLP
jgi:hypothetical protein